MNIEKIGNIIATRRRDLGYTQDQLGEILCVSGKAVSKWERGLSLPDGALFGKIAVALKISIDQLLSGNLDDISRSSNALSSSEDIAHKSFLSPLEVDLSENKNLGFVSPFLFGNNLEHTRSSVCGGLSAQILRNRKFVGKPSPMEGVALEWFSVGEKCFCAFGEPYTHHDREHYHMHRALECNSQDILCLEENFEVGIGQHGLFVEANKVYDFAVVLKSAVNINVKVVLCDRKGEKIYAEKFINVSGGKVWERFELELMSCEDDFDCDLRMTFSDKGCLSVGAVSLMDHNNFRGLRKDVIEQMKALGISILRWPGGNFAGEYNWFDGLLPRDERAPFESFMHLETQAHTMGYDMHEMNTDDFIALCREIGAVPYITINIAWNTPEENAAWVEYCNGDTTTKYGKLRAERGNPEPYNVLLWSLGNEMGYGHMEGDNSPSGYSRLAGENGKKMLEKSDNLTLCSSGPYPNKEWINYSARPLGDIAPLVSAHYYAPSPSYRDLSRLVAEYEKCISGVAVTRSKIGELREMLGEKQKISFDEWNVWLSWYRQSSIIDGIYSAMMMHMFIDEAHKGGIELVCHFEAVNEGLIKVMPNKALLTAAGKAVALMSVHSNAKLVYADDFTVVSEKNGTTSVTFINPSPDKKNRFVLKNAKLKCVESRAYVGKDLLPCSDFEECELEYGASGDDISFELPPLSIGFAKLN